MVAANYRIDSLRERAAQKQASRNFDADRISNGSVTPQQVRRENHVLGGIDLSSFRMVSIGKRRIGQR